MAKRSREDFDPSSPESQNTGELQTSEPPVNQSDPTEQSSTSAKIIQLSPGSGEAEELPIPTMLCSLPPHRQTVSFATYEEYEIHYNKDHVNRCLECRKNFPTEHFLNLHIEENHDALVGVRRERGERTYCCFVEDCERKCSTPQKRRMHLIDKHIFPKDYDFHIVNDGIDYRTSMLMSGRQHRRRSSAAQHNIETDGRARRKESQGSSPHKAMSEEPDQSESPEESEIAMPSSSQGDADMDGLTGAMSSLKFVPTSVRFGRGRGKGRGGFSRT